MAEMEPTLLPGFEVPAPPAYTVQAGLAGSSSGASAAELSAADEGAADGLVR